MIRLKYVLAAVLLGSLSTAALAENKGITLQDRQQAACAKDVEKLCPGLIPDVGKVTDCMKTKRSQVSPECGAMYDAKQ